MKKITLLLVLVCANCFSQSLLYRFDWQNSSASIGTANFSFTPDGAASSLTFDTDRSNVAAKAARIFKQKATATLTGLPTGNAARTISCWALATTNAEVTLFNYGASAAGQSFSFNLIPANNQVAFLGYGVASDKYISQTTDLNVWNHYAITYNGTAVKTYINGRLKDTFTVNLNTANSDFKLGIDAAGIARTGNIKFDALYIYDGALTDAQIISIFKVNDSQTVLRAGVPTSGLVYANHFTAGNTSDSSGTGAVIKTFNATTAATDASGVANNARGFDVASVIDYEVVNYPEMYVGATATVDFTVSAQVKVDPVWYANLATNQYATFFNHGGIYMRILKTSGGGVLQVGYQENNGTFPSANQATISESLFTTDFMTVTFVCNTLSGKSLYINAMGQGYAGLSNSGVFYNAFPKLTLGWGSSPNQDFKGTIDNVFIYNRILSEPEIYAIVNGNSLSNTDFQTNNLKFNLYPNPATDILNIAMETELKSVEIYNIQGQKVLTSDKNQIDVSSLSKGMYMVRVEDVNSLVSTQKLLVK